MLFSSLANGSLKDWFTYFSKHNVVRLLLIISFYLKLFPLNAKLPKELCRDTLQRFTLTEGGSWDVTCEISATSFSSSHFITGIQGFSGESLPLPTQCLTEAAFAL